MVYRNGHARARRGRAAWSPIFFFAMAMAWRAPPPLS
jgi:hypothetical protein